MVWHQATSRAKWTHQPWTNPITLSNICQEQHTKMSKNPCFFRNSKKRCFLTKIDGWGRPEPKLFQSWHYFLAQRFGTRDGRLRGAIWRIPKNWNWRVVFPSIFLRGWTHRKDMIKWSNEDDWWTVKKKWVYYIYNIHIMNIYVCLCVSGGGSRGASWGMIWLSSVKVWPHQTCLQEDVKLPMMLMMKIRK